MVEPGRRPGRRSSGQATSATLLPVHHVSHLTNSTSCWYCDFKTSFFNQPLFRFGRKYS
nr:membrane-bound transcription factor site-2 protease homolog isoform X1 [Tanacetum cinerariifolium]